MRLNGLFVCCSTSLTLFSHSCLTLVFAIVFSKHRYSVQCEPGQLLSYSVTEFNLEPEGNCSDRQECLDWVEITFNNLGIRRKFCGSGELGRVRVEGTNELMFEFASNRETEKEGFSYSVTCIDPGLDQNAVNLGTIQFSPLDKQLPLYSACSQPLNMAPRNTTTEVCLQSHIAYNYHSCAL